MNRFNDLKPVDQHRIFMNLLYLVFMVTVIGGLVGTPLLYFYLMSL